MRDAYGRTIDYIRLSITDRCNLRCRYCLPEDLPSIPHDSIMRYEEILRLCAILAELGIRTFRVTGGEPLARKGCVGFIKQLKELSVVERVALTTNGVLLGPYIDELAACRLDGLNISLDSLDPKKYLQLTGQDAFPLVWQSILSAINAGLRLKLNCVPIRGINEGDILPMARLAEIYPIDVRFIELMPTGAGERFSGVAGSEILSLLLSEYPDLQADHSQRGCGPARYMHSKRLEGRVGLIDAVSNHFCAGCNRLRLTSEGFLKLCLYHDDGLDLRAMLRGGAGDAEIKDAIERSVHQKPERHLFGSVANDKKGIDRMSRIGG